MKKSLGLFTLVMLIIGSIDSIRNLPSTALFGSTLIFFFILSCVIFLLPAGLISAELSAKFPEKGGIFHWVKLAFGDKFAFLAIWLQWINTMVWYPTILSFIAGTAAYLINPHLADEKLYLVLVILGVFWALTLLNMKGVHISARFASWCAIIGMVIPMALIIILAAIWVLTGHPLQIHFDSHNLLPSLSHGNSWISLTAIMTAFLGMELATVQVQHVKNAQKTFPKALVIAIIVIGITMLFGALAIAFVIPASQMNLVDGIMQAFANFFAAYHMQWFLPIIGIMILVGSLGGMINWMISPAKGLLHAAEEGYLPKVFTKQNAKGASTNVLLTQAVLVSIMCLAFLLMPSVNGSYWLLTDLSTELYILMYIFMFLAAISIKMKYASSTPHFKVPGGKVGTWVMGLLGLCGCGLTFVIGFFPPSGINVGSAAHYHLVFTLGILVMIAPVLFFFAYKKFKKHA